MSSICWTKYVLRRLVPLKQGSRDYKTCFLPVIFVVHTKKKRKKVGYFHYIIFSRISSEKCLFNECFIVTLNTIMLVFFCFLFSLSRRIIEGWFNESFPACAFSFLFLRGDELANTKSTLLGQGSVHNGSASWDDCDQAFTDELHVSSFRSCVPTMCLDSLVSQLLGQALMCFTVTCYLHFWQND